MSIFTKNLLLIGSRGLSAQQIVKLFGLFNFTIDFLESEIEIDNALFFSERLKSD